MIQVQHHTAVPNHDYRYLLIREVTSFLPLNIIFTSVFEPRVIFIDKSFNEQVPTLNVNA